jgi:exosome complex component RRP46
VSYHNVQQLKSYVHLVFPNSRKSVDPKESKQKEEEFERGLITSVTHGVISGMAVYLLRFEQ